MEESNVRRVWIGRIKSFERTIKCTLTKLMQAAQADHESAIIVVEISSRCSTFMSSDMIHHIFLKLGLSGSAEVLKWEK